MIQVSWEIARRPRYGEQWPQSSLSIALKVKKKGGKKAAANFNSYGGKARAPRHVVLGGETTSRQRGVQGCVEGVAVLRPQSRR